jgi:hypothetical protein
LVCKSLNNSSIAFAATSVIRDLSISEMTGGWKAKFELVGIRSRSSEGPPIPWAPKFPIDKSKEEM